MYNKSILDDIRDRISIAAYIGERIPLKKAGRNYKGLCPFHNEKTPSFNVSDDKQIYHCFGCGSGGDIFEFVMKFEGQDFGEAVKNLALRAGVEIPRDANAYDDKEEGARAKKKKWCLRVNEVAREFFVARLNDEKSGKRARDYLQTRGITEEILTQHFLGYADNSWDSLGSYLEAKKVPLELASELGLLKQNDRGGYYDFFRDRIIFPIVSKGGDVLGFGGRKLSGDEKEAKYLNSPDSFIYHKSNTVYGLDLAAAPIRSRDSAIFVEGYMDLIALRQSGIDNVVAPLGTALTEGHLRLVGRLTRNFVLIFDGDEAGIKASLRALEIFIAFGAMPRVVILPAGEDPDTMVRKEGREAFEKRIKEAGSLFDFFVDRAVAKAGPGAKGKAEAASHVVQELSLMKDGLERNIYAKAAAEKIGIDYADLKAAADRGAQPKGRQGSEAKGAAEDASSEAAEMALVRAMLVRPEISGRVFESVDSSMFRDEWCRSVAAILKEGISCGQKNLSNIVDSVDDNELALQMRAAALEGVDIPEEELEPYVDDCMRRLKERSVKERLSEINGEIRLAETSRDEARILSLLDEKKRLVREMHE
jgi:DNA primase